MGDAGISEEKRYDLFKFLVELADRTSVRRSAANTFFVSLHSIIASVVGYLAAVKSPDAKTDKFSLAILAVVGIILSLTWWAILRYYRRLSKAKWDVINDFEAELGTAPFTDEWQKLHPEGANAKWFMKQRHREATIVEQVVPLTFAAVYIVLAVRILAS